MKRILTILALVLFTGTAFASFPVPAPAPAPEKLQVEDIVVEKQAMFRNNGFGSYIGAAKVIYDYVSKITPILVVSDNLMPPSTYFPGMYEAYVVSTTPGNFWRITAVPSDRTGLHGKKTLAVSFSLTTKFPETCSSHELMLNKAKKAGQLLFSDKAVGVKILTNSDNLWGHISYLDGNGSGCAAVISYVEILDAD